MKITIFIDDDDDDDEDDDKRHAQENSLFPYLKIPKHERGESEAVCSQSVKASNVVTHASNPLSVSGASEKEVNRQGQDRTKEDATKTNTALLNKAPNSGKRKRPERLKVINTSKPPTDDSGKGGDTDGGVQESEGRMKANPPVGAHAVQSSSKDGEQEGLLEQNARNAQNRVGNFVDNVTITGNRRKRAVVVAGNEKLSTQKATTVNSMIHITKTQVFAQLTAL